MKTCVLLAPGPSLTKEDAERATGDLVGCVGSAYLLRPEVDFIASTDWEWWGKNPEAAVLPCAKYSATQYLQGVIALPGACRQWNSGVLALEVAVRLGAEYIELVGFDMHGTHFFGPYDNGLTNTRPERREIHQQQYVEWRDAHPDIAVVNRTVGSQLRAYPYAE